MATGNCPLVPLRPLIDHDPPQIRVTKNTWAVVYDRRDDSLKLARAVNLRNQWGDSVAFRLSFGDWVPLDPHRSARMARGKDLGWYKRLILKQATLC